MNSKLLLIIVALTVVFGAFTFLGSKKTSPTIQGEKPASANNTLPSPTTVKQEFTTVILSETGFSSKEITVKTGDRVVFLNKSGKTATVSPDDHPTHRLYPFLNLGEFKDGSSLQVVFENKGTYTYHDHYNATSTGTVVVE